MRVNGYNGVNNPESPERRPEGPSRSADVQPAGVSSEPASEVSDAEGGGDTIEISSGAKELLGKSTDAPNPDNVERARQILQSGSYNDTGALEKTAAAVANVLSLNA